MITSILQELVNREAVMQKISPLRASVAKAFNDFKANRAKKNENNENLLNRLEYYSSKPLSSYKFFEEETTGEKENPLQIMTMHKSKGDEFDIVFIPQLNEDNYPLNINTIKLKGASHFVQAIKNDIEKCGIKSPDELKEDQIKETLRLLYVGVTRAKKELYMTNAKKYKNRKETKSVDFIRNLLTTQEFFKGVNDSF